MKTQYRFIFTVQENRCKAYYRENDSSLHPIYLDGEEEFLWHGNATISACMYNYQINTVENEIKIIIFSDNEESIYCDKFSSCQWDYKDICDNALFTGLKAGVWYLNGREFRNKNLTIQRAQKPVYITTFPVIYPPEHSDKMLTLADFEYENLVKLQENLKRV